MQLNDLPGKKYFSRQVYEVRAMVESNAFEKIIEMICHFVWMS